MLLLRLALTHVWSRPFALPPSGIFCSRQVKLEIWDTAGQESFLSITRCFALFIPCTKAFLAFEAIALFFAD